jgi:Domain of unknown function (DUF4160)
MPVVFRLEGMRFHFYSYEGSPREPIHIHVAKPDADAKFWLYPKVRLDYNQGFNAREIRRLIDIIEAHRAQIEEVWNAHFSA